jgi:hypothetical protein
MARYRQAGELTERMLEDVVRGVRFQRATVEPGLQTVSGGDSRTQVGEVAISANTKGAPPDSALASRNVARYRCTGALPHCFRPRSRTHLRRTGRCDTGRNASARVKCAPRVAPVDSLS